MFLPLVRIKQIIEDDLNYPNESLKLGGIWDVLQRCDFDFKYTLENKCVEVTLKSV